MENYEIIWKQALPELENSISGIHYTTFISALTPIDLKGTKLVLLAKSEIQAGMARTTLNSTSTPTEVDASAVFFSVPIDSARRDSEP